ncbi:MAG: MFS transporter [Gammaproteobacteria bacterium]|nr:MFS transporter [Gammaproteobacteria bacterium]
MSSAAGDDHQGAWSLLVQRRFGAFFSTQFLGAFNDNVYKNALVGIFTYKIVTLGLAAEDSQLLINIAGGLFILPFFLFSALAGQVAEKYEKSVLINRIKIFEIIVMLVGAVGLLTNQLWVLMGVLFMMGTQSSFFGPLKYSILPQHLRNDELMGGNALVEMGTFLAILLGTVAGGLLSAIPGYGNLVVSVVAIMLAIAGWYASRFIPPADATAPDLKIKFNIVTQSARIIAHAHRNRTVFLAIMGVSWFWYFGVFVLNQVPSYVADSLSGDQTVVTTLMATFSIGIGIGSMLCARWSGKVVEIGLVPLGAIGMTLFTVHLGLAPVNPGLPEKVHAFQFLSAFGGWRIVMDVLGIAISGGLYIVPLYSLIQTRGDRNHLSRTFAGLNIINSLFMILASVTAVLLLKGGVTTSQLFLVLAAMHVAVAAFIFALVPEFGLRLVAWMLIRLFYRLEERQLNNIPLYGPALLVANHVTYVDALVIGTASRRPPKFVMYHKIYNARFLNPVFKLGKTIPIAPAREDRELLEDAYERIHEALEQGDIVCLFPEGMLTADGEIGEFKSGVEKIIARKPVPVVPVALRGFWGSMFSRRPGNLLQKFPGVLFKRVQIKVGPALAPEQVNKEMLRDVICKLRGDWR